MAECSCILEDLEGFTCHGFTCHALNAGGEAYNFLMKHLAGK